MSAPVPETATVAGATTGSVAVASTKKQEKLPLSPVENAAVGAFGGVCEVIVDQPLVYFKNALQQGKPLSWHPMVLYRGFGINAGSMAPITAIQVAADGYFKGFFHRRNTQSSTTTTTTTTTNAASNEIYFHQKILASFLAGCFSATVSSPAELIMLRQQNSGDAFGKTLREMWSARGPLGYWRGFSSAAIRDGGFSVGYLALADVVRKELDSSFASPTGEGPAWSTLAGGVLAGVAAAIFTHPFDTIKTDIQADFNRQKSTNLLQAINLRASNAGWLSFYQGVGPRGMRVIIGVCLLSWIKDTLTNVLRP